MNVQWLFSVSHNFAKYRPTAFKLHTRTLVRKCCNGDHATQWKKQNSTPSSRHNLLTNLDKNWHGEKSWIVPGVRCEPSSLLADHPPPMAAATGNQRSRVAASPTSLDSRVSPWRRGWLPSGDPTALPVLSLRAEGMEALSQPPCTGWMWEASFPTLVVVVDDEGNPTELVTFTP